MLETQPTVVSLTDAAAVKLRELTAEETNPAIGLRVYVYSGGCSGFRYGMMLEDAPTAEDRILDLIDGYPSAEHADLARLGVDPDMDVLVARDTAVRRLDAVLDGGDQLLSGDLLLGVELQERTDEITTHGALLRCFRISWGRQKETWGSPTSRSGRSVRPKG